MKNLRFDDGCQSFTINGDKERVIRFNPGDVNLIKRCNTALKNIMAAKEGIPDIALDPDGNMERDGLDLAASALQGIDDVIRENVNTMFDGDVYDTVFGGQSPFCIVGKEGKYLFEAFMDSVIPFIQAAAKEAREASAARVDKYTKGYKK